VAGLKTGESDDCFLVDREVRLCSGESGQEIPMRLLINLASLAVALILLTGC
jgi:hypothetical protein